MIRTVMAAVIAASIILFVWQYAAFTDRIRPEPIQIIEMSAQGQYDVRVVCTFDCLGNAFGSPAIVIKFRDQVVAERKEHLAAGEVLLVKNVSDIKQGLNDFLIQVTPAEGTAVAPGGAFSLNPPSGESVPSTVARAVNVEILHNGNRIAGDLFWSSVSGPFGQLVKIRVDKEEHEHQVP